MEASAASMGLALIAGTLGEGDPPAAEPLLMDGGDPPAGDPPAGDPPADPPVGDPPADPPADPNAPPEEKPEEKPEGAPEAYAEFTAPEGVELDAETLDVFKAAAKELNLPQAKAQQFVDMAAALAQKQAAAFTSQIEQTTAEWRQSSMADPEFGGTKLGESLKVAAAARDKFATPELTKFLAESKLGDHPEVIRLFYKVGQAISEDTTVLPGKPVNTASFYDHPTSKAKSA